VSNRLNKLLENWLINKDKSAWVLATIIATDGSSYRKPGAMMMINDLGQYFGLLSGGCLESDIMRQARRCWEDGHNRIIEYDMREEEDLAWQLGIGCGGMVRILLQAVNTKNHYLQLDLLFDKLQQNIACHYQQMIHENEPENKITPHSEASQQSISRLNNAKTGQLFVQFIKPAPHLAIFGGGVDARPLVAMAAELGWQVTLVDPRTSYARAAYFAGAQQIIREPVDTLENSSWLMQLDMFVIMSHNIKLDGQALSLAQRSSAKYIGMLGPGHRTQRVLDSAGLTPKDLSTPLANPIGLRLGGELPESIALSILSEAHAFIENSDANSISGILTK
jgi:xanthine/CO dehydrogenase XdhC/CoxF family maturation factor